VRVSLPSGTPDSAEEGSDDGEAGAAARLHEVNAVFGLLLILTQASTPAAAVRLATTAVPSIVPGHEAVAWHPARSGEHYQQAPDDVAPALTRLTAPGRLAAAGSRFRWAFPLTAAFAEPPVFLVTGGNPDLSRQQIFLLAVLAQICGTVVTNHELAAEAVLRAQATRERDIAQAHAAELAESEARLQVALAELTASRTRLVAASDAARQRVTRDLHDGAQQWFVTTLINLQLADQKWESTPEQAHELLGRAIQDARRGVEDLRGIAAGLHPAILTQRGLAAAIGALAARMPLPVHLDVPRGRLPGAVEASVYFLCAEALTNVVKHAGAGQAWVRVTAETGRCTVEVRDDGIGGARPRSESGGLTGLRDRVGTLGGTLEILGPDGGGTLLRAEIPLAR
jgi:signal transduction histidine kinase